MPKLDGLRLSCALAKRLMSKLRLSQIASVTSIRSRPYPTQVRHLAQAQCNNRKERASSRQLFRPPDDNTPYETFLAQSLTELPYRTFLTQLSLHNFPHRTFLTELSLHNFPYTTFLTQLSLHNFPYTTFLTELSLHNFLTQLSLHNFPYTTFLTQSLHSLRNLACGTFLKELSYGFPQGIPLTPFALHNLPYGTLSSPYATFACGALRILPSELFLPKFPSRSSCTRLSLRKYLYNSFYETY
jgi:hypothetical protein